MKKGLLKWSWLGFIGFGLWRIIHNEQKRKVMQPISRESSPALCEGALPPEYLCWNCHESNIVPDDVHFSMSDVATCQYCNMDNEVTVVPLDPGYVLIGHMPVTNRISKYFA